MDKMANWARQVNWGRQVNSERQVKWEMGKMGHEQNGAWVKWEVRGGR